MCICYMRLYMYVCMCKQCVCTFENQAHLEESTFTCMHRNPHTQHLMPPTCADLEPQMRLAR